MKINIQAVKTTAVILIMVILMVLGVSKLTGHTPERVGIVFSIIFFALTIYDEADRDDEDE